jgi:hypothetical protein
MAISRGSWKVLIADLKSSTRLPIADRVEVDRALQRAISRVMKMHGKHFRLAPEVLRGDELQAVLRPTAPTLSILTYLRGQLMLGAEQAEGLRAGIGQGQLSRVSSKGPFASEGEAFHRAREALDSIKDSRSSRMTAWRSGNHEFDGWAEVVLGLVDALGERWTRPQWEAILGRLEGRVLHEIGRQKGVRFQNVSKRLLAAFWKEVHAAIQHLDDSSTALIVNVRRTLRSGLAPEKGERTVSPRRG